VLTANDKWAIAETLSLHGHLFDGGLLDRLDELFTPDVVYDISEFGYDVLQGIDEIRDIALRLGPDNPLAHIVTNIVINGGPDDDTATVWSKALSVLAADRCSTATYHDTVRRGADGWRISHRRIERRDTPLGGRSAAT